MGASGKHINVPIGDGSGMFDHRLYVPDPGRFTARRGKVETYEFNDYLTRINAGLGADIDIKPQWAGPYIMPLCLLDLSYIRHHFPQKTVLIQDTTVAQKWIF